MMQSAAGGPPPLDTTIVVTTPENVAFDFRIAGPFPRFLALFVDLAILVAALIAIAIITSLINASAIGLFLFLLFISWWGYGGLMETFCNGQTLGKRALGIRVVSDSGLAISSGQAILRNVLRAADLVPPFFPGVIAMLFSSRFQRLGDLAAETMVVFDGMGALPRTATAFRMTDDFRSQIPAHFRPDSMLIESLAAYVGRRNELSKPRRRELSAYLATPFIRMWNLPSKSDPDFVLCALYEYATTDVSDEQDRSISEEPIFAVEMVKRLDAAQIQNLIEQSTEGDREGL